MNSLSWILYLADVFGSLKNFLIPISALSIFASVIYFIFFRVGWVLEGCKREDLRKESNRLVRYLWIPLLGLLISGIIPSQQTIYMIAASEAGETIVKTPEAKVMLNSVVSLIQKKLTDELEDKPK